ncbi:MAG TPA: hypothetical protein VG476_16625 [Acidimicrobiales bacterium]|nr:hypothetical protein [Acidimicrobiales bacterium]
MAALALLAIMSVVATLNLGEGAGSAPGGSSGATPPPSPAPAISPARASRVAAYDDGRAYGQSLQHYASVPELIACAAAPRDWTSDQAPAWLRGCRDSYSIPKQTEGGLVP